MVVSDVERTSLVLVVEVSPEVVAGVVVDSVLTVVVSIGSIISTTNISVSLFKPGSFKVIGTVVGTPNMWTSLRVHDVGILLFMNFGHLTQDEPFQKNLMAIYI